MWCRYVWVGVCYSARVCVYVCVCVNMCIFVTGACVYKSSSKKRFPCQWHVMSHTLQCRLVGMSSVWVLCMHLYAKHWVSKVHTTE